MTKSTKRVAFTLAEVLITLGIIGVVSAMTILNLIAKSQNEQAATKLKKAYSTLSQAILMLRSNEGPVWEAYNYRDHKTDVGYDMGLSLRDALAKYLSGAKLCNQDECVPSSGLTNYKNFNNTQYIQVGNLGKTPIYLADGMMVSVACHSSPDTLIMIWVDTNGYGHKPNRLGYDLFTFELTPNDVIMPGGSPNTYRQLCDASPSGSTEIYNGYGCTLKALNESNYFANLP